MCITVKEVLNKKDLKTFIRFPYQLYSGHPCFVPPLYIDEENTLRKDINPAFDYCDARYWLAYRGAKVVGRIAGIVNSAYIDKWQSRYVRFGWFDLEEDELIAAALMEKVEAWARSLHMEAVHGPLGFTDLDQEGLLVDGFEQRGTIAARYNHAYYPRLLEGAGYQKDTDWMEYKINVPEGRSVRLQQLSDVVMRRHQLQVLSFRRSKELLPYAPELFALLNSTYASLYGVVPLTHKQVAYYTRQYFSFIRPDFVTLVADRYGKLAAFSITMPSMSKALQKSGGKLYPFGFIHLLKALYKNDTADLLLIGVRNELQGKGVNAVLMNETLNTFLKHGIKTAEASHQLESNIKVQKMWHQFDAVMHKRRRCYIKFLNKESI